MVESSSPEGNGRDQVEKVRVELVSCGEEEDQTEEYIFEILFLLDMLDI